MKKLVFLFVCIFSVLLCVPRNRLAALNVISTDIVTFIDGNPIESYLILKQIFVSVEDLKGYGFLVTEDKEKETILVILEKSETTKRVFFPKEKINVLKEDYIVGKSLYPVQETTKKVYLEEKQAATVYMVEERICIPIEELKQFGSINWEEETRQIRVEIWETQLKENLNVIFSTRKTNSYLNAFNETTIGVYKYGKNQGKFFCFYDYVVNDGTNYFYDGYNQNYLQYENDELNGYCLFTSFRDDSYPCERIEGYYTDGKLNGWVRHGFANDNYRYGYYVENVVQYIDGELQLPRDLVPTPHIIDISATGLTSENRDVYHALASESGDTIEPYFFKNGLKKSHRGQSGFFELYMDGRLMRSENRKYKYVLFAEDAVDVSSSCYLTREGNLYNENQTIIMKDVKAFISLHPQDNESDNETIVLKKDGSVWQCFIPRDYFPGDSQEYLGPPLFIMEDCVALFGSYNKTFALKSDHSLWS